MYAQDGRRKRSFLPSPQHLLVRVFTAPGGAAVARAAVYLAAASGSRGEGRV